ncbi:hypothetical protein I6L80_21240 (plasmid) [Providencia rettgeri]|uniref:Uncharacterized protein n=1 Tax=Providencia rettgeri TaxID=587 RepID=A0A379LQ31_PRORE|nr:hypothetical protein [Providencia rettgeri]QXB07802.1 hypothetical protein I6L80_21240 [Providencia rettgeri]SUD99034.1 Uncharacterised protein [Providencia rettgeri]
MIWPFKKKKIKINDKEFEYDHFKKAFLTMILNDEVLMLPCYLPEIKSEADSQNLGIGPLIYIWNYNDTTKTYSLSVNGKCIAHLLEGYIPREHHFFNQIRDEAMKVVMDISLSTIKKIPISPDILFSVQK